MAHTVDLGRIGSPKPSRFSQVPKTAAGRWGAVFAVLWLLIFAAFLGMFLPLQGTSLDAGWREVPLALSRPLMFATGVAAGWLCLMAIVRHRERSWLVMLGIVPIVFGIVVFAAEAASILVGGE